MSLPKLHSHHTSSFGTSSRSRANPEPHSNRVTAANRYTVPTSLSSSHGGGIPNWLNKTVSVCADSTTKSQPRWFRNQVTNRPGIIAIDTIYSWLFPSVLFFPISRMKSSKFWDYCVTNGFFGALRDSPWVTLSFQTREQIKQSIIQFNMEQLRDNTFLLWNTWLAQNHIYSQQPLF